jgi:hypothetical protein
LRRPPERRRLAAVALKAHATPRVSNARGGGTLPLQ